MFLEVNFKDCLQTSLVDLAISLEMHQSLLNSLLNLSIDMNNNLTKTLLSPDTAQNSQKIVKIDLKSVRKGAIEESKEQSAESFQVSIEMDFRDLFNDELKSIDEAIEKLNFEASFFGHKFKKGSSDKSRGYAALYCKQK